MRAELSAYEGVPIRWAARLTGHGQDALAYAEASPSAGHLPDGSADGERLIELRRTEMNALRVYLHLSGRLQMPPAEGLVERVRTARLLGNLWALYLNADHITSLAYAFRLRAVGGFASEANRFARHYGVAFRPDEATGSLQPTQLR
ncbi:DUF6417 family protein [Streptomyces sp. NPDC004561]